MTASSEWAADYGPSYARLNIPVGWGKARAWSAKTNDLGQWIQVNLRELTRVTKVAIQGRQDVAQWVTAFKLSYSLDGKHFEPQKKIYQGNNDQNNVVLNTLMEPIEARFIRLHPYAWYGHISMRMELYGCSLKPECAKPLGLENYGIPNSAITASSEWDSNHGPTNARLNRPSGGGTIGAWSAKISDASQWIQVAFLEVTRITNIGIQGRYDYYDQWVTKFKVSYSLDGVHFITQSKVSLMKLQIKTHIKHKIIPKLQGYAEKDCDWPLGIQSKYIPNSDMTASSEWAADYGPSYARLNIPVGWGKARAWSAKTNDLGQWIQVNLRELTRVTKVAIQGRQDVAQWVTAFKLSYSLDGKHFEPQKKIYQGNNDQNNVVLNTLMEPIEARFIRLHPYAWYGHISMRMELYGCSLKPECAKPLGLENYGIPNSAITASSEWDSNHGPTNARLNRPSGGGTIGAWSAKISDASQWIQVAFLEVTRITNIGIQGRYDYYDQWVTKFKVSYSLDGVHFITQSKVYNGNSDRNGIVINDLETPIEARVIRINPVEWHGHIAMRMELYGCRLQSGNLNVFLFYAMFRRRRRFSLECRKYSNFHLLWFGHITLHEWLKILAQLCRPVSSKTKTNCGSLTNLFLSLVSGTCICLEF
ncbi:lactadherin-like [Orbicella faveolata]|uniref:lactadherin-like n=1 Tax=Orbicella faveolata TaxID=48498 RepID=UPI0009E4A01A|nr:lactadherin-like [Orbicella faveolata]